MSGPSGAPTALDRFHNHLEMTVRINDPVVGFSDVAGFKSGSPAWPGLPTWAQLQEVREIVGAIRTVSEYILIPHDDEAPPLRFAVVWDDSQGARRHARVYYDSRAFGYSVPRPPVVAPDRYIARPHFMGRFEEAMVTGDPDVFAAALAADAIVHESTAALDGAKFASIIGNPSTPDDNRDGRSAGVPLQFCTVTTDGAVAAAEHVVWRRPPHAGLGVYTQGPDGRINEFRVYETPAVH